MQLKSMKVAQQKHRDEQNAMQHGESSSAKVEQ
jgi:hypothetical protein